MGYISLYRKYRPKNFSEVVGQEVVIKTLKNSIKNNQIAHAYIFSGPRGTGKTSIAKIFAKAVNCLNTDDGDLCGKCDVCTKDQSENIDIIEIDAASNNGVEEIREIRNSVKLLPSSLKYKVYIIDEVHMLSISAFNALLKTLEEPPAHVIFILATTEFNKIPITVVSRCQKFEFSKILKEDLVKRIKYILKEEKKKLSDEVIELIAEISDGGCRDAITLTDQVLAQENEKITENEVYDLIGEVNSKQTFAIFDRITKSDIAELIKYVDKLYEEGKNFVNLVNKLLKLCKDLIIYNNTNGYFDEKYENKLHEFVKLDINKLIEMSSILLTASEELKKTKNQKMLLDIYLLKVSLLFNNKKEIENVEKIAEEKVVIKTNIEETKLESKENLNDNTVDINKEIKINNAFAGASKEKKNEIVEKFKNLDEYLTDKDFSSISKLLEDANIEVVSEKNIIFSFKKEFNITLFNKNIENVEKLTKKLIGTKYSVVAVSEEEWIQLRKEYIKNLTDGVKYTYKEEKEKKVRKNTKKSELEIACEDMFGEITIEE